MEPTKSSKEQLAEGRLLEQSGDLEAAAQLYRKLVGQNPRQKDAVNRLLMVYRKRKDYRAELAAIDQVLAAYESEDKARQKKWVREHSTAAAAGAAIFQQLGGSGVAGFGAEPAVATWLKRRAVVERKISGKKTGKKTGKKAGKSSAASAVPMHAALGKGRREKVAAARPGSRRPLQQQAGATRQHRQTGQERKALEKRRTQQERKQRRAAAAAERNAAIEQRKKQVAARKAEAAAKKARQTEAKKAREEAARKAAAERKAPSLFVVILRYQAPLEEIDAVMAAHEAFVDKQYKNEKFLASGRQEQRVGWILLLRGKSPDAVKRLLQADPLVRKGLATLEVAECKVSRMDKGLAPYFNRR